MIRESAHGCTLAVHAQPGAKKTTIKGIYGEGEHAALKIAVQAPPVEGRANQALIAFLAKTFALSRSSVEILNGELSRDKLFLLQGISAAEAEAVLRKTAPLAIVEQAAHLRAG